MKVTPTEIRRQLTKLGLLPPGRSIGDSDSLTDSDVIDSLLLMGLITHLEAEYRITIDVNDLVPENFDSIEAITSYVERSLSVCEDAAG